MISLCDFDLNSIGKVCTQTERSWCAEFLSLVATPTTVETKRKREMRIERKRHISAPFQKYDLHIAVTNEYESGELFLCAHVFHLTVISIPTFEHEI